MLSPVLKLRPQWLWPWHGCLCQTDWLKYFEYSIKADLLGFHIFAEQYLCLQYTKWCKKKKHLASGSFAGRNTFLMTEVREEWRIWFEVTVRLLSLKKNKNMVGISYHTTLPTTAKEVNVYPIWTVGSWRRTQAMFLACPVSLILQFSPPFDCNWSSVWFSVWLHSCHMTGLWEDCMTEQLYSCS